MVLEVKSSFSHHMLAAERGINYRSFGSHMRSKLLQCGEDTHTLSQVHDTRRECQLVLLGFEKNETAAMATKASFLNFRPKLEDCIFKIISYIDTASASMHIII